jgi:hypothetical protein
MNQAYSLTAVANEIFRGTLAPAFKQTSTFKHKELNTE